MTDTARQWPVKDARASFSELVDRALDGGPQIVTRNGKPTVVVVSIEEWDRRSRRKGDLVDFFAGSPLHEEGVEITRLTDYPREVDV
jgi:prevent-host-death family protein